MSLFDKLKKASEDVKKSINDGTALEKAKEVASVTASKSQEAASKAIEVTKEYSENRKKQKEETEAKIISISEAKHKEINENYDESLEGIFDRYTKEELVKFSKDIYEKLCMPCVNWNVSSLKSGGYLEDKALKKIRNKYAKNINSSESPLMVYSVNGDRGFLLTDEALYFSMKDIETDLVYSAEIKTDKIQKFDVEKINEKVKISINGVDLFYMDYIEKSEDYENLKCYIDKIKSGNFEITEVQISEQIERKMDEKLLKRVKGFLDEDESIIYIAWGLDSITARDFVVCTNKQLILIDREFIGMSENVKQFEYVDIVSIGTAKSNSESSLLSNALSTVLKQTNIELYVAGTSFKIETLLRVEAERVIAITNEYKKKMRNEEKASLQRPIIQEKEEGALDKIKKLADLREAGILTEDEFQNKKMALLDQI